MSRFGKTLGIVAFVALALGALPAGAETPPPVPPRWSPGDRDRGPEEIAEDLRQAAVAAAPMDPAPEAVPGQLMVRYEEGTSRSERAASAAAADVEVVDASLSPEVALVETAPAEVDAAVEELQADPDVESVDPNYLRTADDVPSDPLWPQQSQELSLIRAPQAWDLTRSSGSVRVGVLDSGIDLDHPDLAGRIALAESFVPGEGPEDILGHGTAVAGVIAANENNGQGISGVAPNALIYSLKVFDSDGRTTDAILWDALERATMLDLDVVNLSMSGSGASQALASMIEDLISSGTVVVASSGNDGVPFPQYPAAYPGVIAVGATDATGDPAYWSNHGAWISVVAPGVDVPSTALTPGAAGSYAAFSGTSFSAPLVSGVAALRARPARGIANGHLKAYDLIRTAQDRGIPGYDTSYGYGIVDAFAALGAGQVPTPTPNPAAGDADGTIDRATLIGASATSSIFPPSDEDWFAFDVTTLGRLEVTVTPPTQSFGRTREMDPMVEIYNADHQLVAVEDSESTGVPENAGANAVPGRYYIRVGNFHGSASPDPYTVEVTTGGPYVPETWEQVSPFDEVTYPAFLDTAAVTDVTGDDRGDLLTVVTSDRFSQPWVLRTRVQQPDGSHGTPQDLVIPNGTYSTPLGGDFNGDGIGDVVVPNAGAHPIRWGSDDGPVAGDASITTFQNSAPVVVDLDADGTDELLGHSDSDTLSVFAWDGSTFTSTALLSVPIGSMFVKPVAGDLVGDGREELVVSVSDEVRLYEQGDTDWTYTLLWDGYQFNQGATLADVDADSDLDLVTAGYDGELAVARAFLQEDGELSPGDETLIPTGVDLTSGDLDGDGVDEVVQRAWGSEDPRVYRARAGGVQMIDVLDEVGWVYNEAMSVADADGDGLDDILLENGARVLLTVHGEPAASLPQGAAWVRTTTPRHGADAVSRTANLTVQSYRDLTPSSVSADSVWLFEGRSGELVSGAVSFSSTTDTITFNPSATLLPSTPYTLVVAGVTANDGGDMPLVLVGLRTASGARPGVSVSGTYLPITGDLNGDEATDILWYGNGGTNATWLGGTTGIQSLGSFGGWTSGLRPRLFDWDGDRYDDLLVYHPTSTTMWDYVVPGGEGRGDILGTYFQRSSPYIPLTGDFDGDGFEDLFWYGPGTAKDEIWFGGVVPTRKRTVSVSGTYRPVVGDFNGDLIDDVFWHGPGSTADAMWRFSPTGHTSVGYSVSGSYQVFAGDFTGNGIDDIFFYAPGTAGDAFWHFTKSGRTSRSVTVNGTTYRPAVGDFDADGFDDLLLYAPGTTGDTMWWGTTTGARSL